MKVKLGDLVKDKISGFAGVATSRTEFLNGCVRVGISPKVLTKEGKLFEPEVFDEEQLERTKEADMLKSMEQKGGDRPTPGRAPDITR